MRTGNALRADDRRSWYRKLDLIHGGRTFLRRRGLDLRIGGILIHRIDAPDPGLDLHDHPWTFWTLIVRGGYTEEVAEAHPERDTYGYCPNCGCATCSHRLTGCRWCPCNTVSLKHEPQIRVWRRWSLHRMPLEVAHRITACEPRTVTLVVRGPKVRRWGFYLPTGWIDWEDYDYAARRPVSVDSNKPEERMP